MTGLQFKQMSRIHNALVTHRGRNEVVEQCVKQCTSGQESSMWKYQDLASRARFLTVTRNQRNKSNKGRSRPQEQRQMMEQV